MKIIAAFVLYALLFFYNDVQSQNNNQYDPALAKKLNADEYGMKSYILVILKKGPANITDKKTMDSIFRGHMANIQRLASENKLVVAGPIDKNDKAYEGIFVFNTSNMEEAKQWLNTDPAIQSKNIDADLYSWYCTAALQEIPALHKQVQKISF